jgi:hypothetical protein
VRITYNDVLLQLDNAFPSLAGGHVQIDNNDAMTRMDNAFPLLTSASYLQISSNAKLASVVTAFVKVTSLTSTGTGLTITSNAELVDVPGFEQEVQFTGSQVNVYDNAKLVSLTGLHQLKFTHPDGARLQMYLNPLLSQEAVCGFWDAVKARGNPPQKGYVCSPGDGPMWGVGGSCGSHTPANC